MIRLESPAEKRQRVLREVCEAHGVRFVDLTGPSRVKHLTAARHEACYRLRDEVGLSWPRIGTILGGRDHSTIIYGARKHAQTHGLTELTPQSQPAALDLQG